MVTKDIAIEEYNYPLPEEQIAKFPLSQRDDSKLLVYRQGNITETNFNQLPAQIPADSMLVFNNTKVIQARLHFQKTSGAKIEIFCLEPHLPLDYNLSFQSTCECTWLCMIGNAKKWKEGKLELVVSMEEEKLILEAERGKTFGNSHLVTFSWKNPKINFAQILHAVGELPIPPYLNRKTEEADTETYQTVYSKIEGSVAAPTAGLHFTPAVLSQLEQKQIPLQEVTLHVGAGTFQPVKSEKIAEHAMHSEFISVRREFIEALLAHPGKIIAVGTTSVRTLESLFFIGAKLHLYPDTPIEELPVKQWQPYEEEWNNVSKEQALQAILKYMSDHQLAVLHTSTQIMIAPGYQFRIIAGIVTNFHQPKSTLLLLISALIGEDWKEVYQYALTHQFRFLSYGDSSLLLKKD